MATLLFLGPAVDGNRDTYRVDEEISAVIAKLQSSDRFVAFTDPGDGADVWFRVDAVRYFYAD